MERLQNFMLNLSKLIWAIFAAVMAVFGVYVMINKNPKKDEVLAKDDKLDNAQTQVDSNINQIKDEINNINTSGLSDEQIADYFNTKKRQ